MNILNELKTARFIAILRRVPQTKIVRVAEALLQAGIRFIEITFGPSKNIHKRLSPEVIEAKLKTYAIHRAATAEEVAECVVNTICCGAMTGEVVNLNSGVYFPV